MAKGRKPVYQSKDERAVVISLRVPRDLEKQLKEYARIHRQSVTEVVLEGIRMRLETPADPRDIILSDDNTVRHELQEMIRAQVQAEIGKLHTFMGSAFDVLKLSPTPEAATPLGEVLADAAAFLEDEDDEAMPGPEAAAELVSEVAYDSHTGVQESARQTAVPDYDEEERLVPQPIPASSTASQPERHEPAVKTMPALTEDIVKITEARRQDPDISEREFIQRLFDRGIYRHRAKDGSEVPLPHTTYRDWMKKAREAGLA
jgi:hypothetical protein